MMENDNNALTEKKMDVDDTRQRIVQNAIGLFNTRGVRSVTMDDVAHSLRMSKRTLYEWFDSKEALLSDCLMTVHDEIAKAHKAVGATVEEPLLLAMFMLKYDARLTHHYHHLVMEAERYYPELHDQYFTLHTTHFRQMLQKGMQYALSKGYLREDVNIDLIVDVMTRYMQAYRLSSVDDSEEYARRLSEVAYTFIRGLMTVETLQRLELQSTTFRQRIEEMENVWELQEKQSARY